MSIDKAAELSESIAASIAALCSETDRAKQSETFKAWLRTMGKFHSYSFGNTLLIWSQAPDATKVAGFNTWKSLGRYVRKGETGIRILAPLVRKIAEDKRSEDKVSQIYGFRCVSVFDYAQTDGEPLPGLNSNATEGGEDVLPVLEQVVSDLQINLEYKTISGAAEGVSYGGRIEVEESLDTPARFGVLTHELAHELLHKVNHENTTREQRELEAESVSYAVLTHFGLNPQSQLYLALYGITPEMLTASLQAISTTAKRIIGLITEAAAKGQGEESISPAPKAIEDLEQIAA